MTSNVRDTGAVVKISANNHDADTDDWKGAASCLRNISAFSLYVIFLSRSRNSKLHQYTSKKFPKPSTLRKFEGSKIFPKAVLTVSYLHPVALINFQELGFEMASNK